MKDATKPTTLAATLQSSPRRKLIILRLKEVQVRTGLGRSAIYYLQNERHWLFDARFPHSIKLGAHAVGWVECEVEAWLEYRIAASRGSFKVEEQ